MDCTGILEILDCVRPNSGDLDLPEFAEARTHLDGCESCRHEFESRQQFDRAVSAVAQDVEVPAGLQESLLSALSAETADAVHAVTPDEIEEAQKTKRGRLRTRLSLAALVCTAAMALIVTNWPRDPESFSVDLLLGRAEADPEKVLLLEEYSGEVAAVPRSFFGHHSLGTDKKSYGKDLDEDSTHDIVMTRFKFKARGHSSVTGVIVAVPASRITALPTAKSFSGASRLYPSPSASGFGAAAVVWKEGDTVYLCFVPLRYAPALETLQRELRGVAA
jgi:hypothetical protein